MNLSGQAVRAVASYLKITPAEILVAHDEVDLPVGTIKLKYDGGDGGHNGLKDIIRHLNTKQFYRLRIGVSRPRPGQDTADYVLDKPSKSDRKQIDLCISQSLDALPLLLAGEFQKAMQLLHTQEQ
jgi:PTH1 family peptidyl-tRNA hydrolase